MISFCVGVLSITVYPILAGYLLLYVQNELAFIKKTTLIRVSEAVIYGVCFELVLFIIVDRLFFDSNIATVANIWKYVVLVSFLGMLLLFVALARRNIRLAYARTLHVAVDFLSKNWLQVLIIVILGVIGILKIDNASEIDTAISYLQYYNPQGGVLGHWYSATALIMDKMHFISSPEFLICGMQIWWMIVGWCEYTFLAGDIFYDDWMSKTFLCLIFIVYLVPTFRCEFSLMGYYTNLWQPATLLVVFFVPLILWNAFKLYMAISKGVITEIVSIAITLLIYFIATYTCGENGTLISLICILAVVVMSVWERCENVLR